MGKLYEHFKNCSFSNEAEVSQKFIIPLLQKYLGYNLNEIIPEKHFPAKTLYSGVNFSIGGSKGLNHRPDYVVCIEGDYKQVRFVIDSKGPNEQLDEHLGQLRSYANSVGRNFLMITNGNDVMVYDVNTLIFRSKGIKDLQIKLDELIKLLGKRNQQIKSPIEILQAIDLSKSVSNSESEKTNHVIEHCRLQLADFKSYLSNITIAFKEWHLPTSQFRAISNLDIKKFDPNELLSFKSWASKTETPNDKVLKFSQIENEQGIRTRILIGETGAGKTSLLKYLTLQAAKRAQDLTDLKIPIYIQLKEIGHGYNLEMLIMAFLHRHGYLSLSFVELCEFNQFIFFFDAFDEVTEIFQREVSQAITNISLRHECYLTTRPNALPRIQMSASYTILPLTDTQVKEISKTYMESKYYDFQRQVENNGLITETRNILLLLFLISLYKEDGKMPNTIAGIIWSVVDRVRLWQEGKDEKKGSLTWEVLSQCLSKIAFEIGETDDASMSIIRAEPILRSIIIEQETLRRIPQGITTQFLLDTLQETGLLIINNDHLYFWHRLFLNHFGAISLKERYLQDHNIIAKLSNDERWEVVIISMCSTLSDITPVIQRLKKKLWLAAYCLIENPRCAGVEKDHIINTLVLKLSSPVSDLRSRAMFYLERIDNTRTRKILMEIFDQEHYSDVKMMALPAIGKTGSEEAKRIIYMYLNWDDSDFFLWRSSQSYVVQALSFYGEDGYLQIIENWKKYGHIPLHDACKKIFLRLHAIQKPRLAIKHALQQLYIHELTAPNKYREKISAIAEVLTLTPDADFAEKVLEIATQEEIPFTKLDSLISIMKSCNSVKIAEKISKVIFKKDTNHHLGEYLAKALKENATLLPKEFYKNLISHPNVNIASTALESLERFPYSEVKLEIDKHLYGKQAQLQSRALTLLIKKGKFIDLVRHGKFPRPYYAPTAHVLLEAVRRFHLTEALPLLCKIQDALSNDKRYQGETALAYELAGTFYYIGEEIRQVEIISWYFNGTAFIEGDECSDINLMKNAKFLEPKLAHSIAACYYLKYVVGRIGESYEFEVFLETAEDMGGEWMREKVKEITIAMIYEIDTPGSHTKHHLERPFRTLVKIGRPDDEIWVLNLLDKLDYDVSFEYPQLRRALEFLAYHGSKLALPSILKIGDKHKLSESLLNICQFAYNNICSRNKLTLDDRDSFEN